MTALPVLARFAQAVADVAAVDKANTADTGSYKYRYAGLPETLAEARRVCAAHDLVFSQNLGLMSNEHGDYLTVTATIIACDTGQTHEWPAAMCKVPADPQKLASASTYLRRYQLTALFAIPTPDDDGQAASRGLNDEAAAERENHTQAGRTFDLISKSSSEVKDAVKALAADTGHKATRQALTDPVWRGQVLELIETMTA